MGFFSDLMKDPSLPEDDRAKKNSKSVSSTSKPVSTSNKPVSVPNKPVPKQPAPVSGDNKAKLLEEKKRQLDEIQAEIGCCDAVEADEADEQVKAFIRQQKNADEEKATALRKEIESLEKEIADASAKAAAKKLLEERKIADEAKKAKAAKALEEAKAKAAKEAERNQQIQKWTEALISTISKFTDGDIRVVTKLIEESENDKVRLLIQNIQNLASK